VTELISISAENCKAATGMSWSWVLRFAQAHGVQVRKLARKHLVSARELEAAMDRVAAAEPVAAQDAVRQASQRARLRAEIDDELRKATQAQATATAAQDAVRKATQRARLRAEIDEELRALRR
jgi:multidrug resistance efflux pump